MASFRKPVVNRQLKSPFANDINNSDAKFKGRGVVGGVVVPNRIFVGGICPKATVEDLGALFRKYGSVTSIKIVSDQNGSSKGYGFVTFEKADDVSRLQCDAENLFINNRQLNIAPAIMKNPPYMGRYPESFVMPLASNLYFTNGLPYQYSEGTPVYPNSSYTPQVAVLPTVSDAAYYPTPYHGTALFYPLSPSTPQIVVGSHQPYSSYQQMHSNNSNYAYSSPATQTTSPPNSTGKPSSLLNVPTSTMNGPDMHISQGTPVMTNMPPNMTSLPPPVPYPISHPPQYYNGTVLPQFTGDMYYNMVPGTCYPMMAVNGQDAYVPYYDVGEACHSNIPSECHLLCTQESNVDASNNYPVQPSYQSDMINSGKESSPPANNSNNNNNGDTTKALVPFGPPPVTAAPEQEHPYSADNNNSNANGGNGANNNSHHSSHNHSNHNSGTSGTPPTPTLAQQPPLLPQQQQQPPPPPSHVDYNSSSTYIHRSTATAIIYPNPPMPQQNLFFNSVYMTEATSASLVGPCPYSKNLSDHYVSDHLPKRDIKHTPKKFNGAAVPKSNSSNNSNNNNNNNSINNHANNINHNNNKDTPPNIPKFPFLVNNNYPGFVNRNMKEKDYKNSVGGGNVGPKSVEGKLMPRPPRNNSAVGGGGSMPPKPRVFHNQNQYIGPPRSQRIDRNGHFIPNMQYSRSGPPVMSRQNSYDQPQPNPYDYQNNYHHHHHHHHQGHANYLKHMGYDSHRRYHQGGNNGGGYRATKHEKNNGSANEVISYQKNSAIEERPRKYNQQEEAVTAAPPASSEHAQPEQSSTPVCGNVQPQLQSQPQPQQLCAEMQKLAV